MAREKTNTELQAVMLPAGTKAKIEEAAKAYGCTPSQFCRLVICEHLGKMDRAATGRIVTYPKP